MNKMSLPSRHRIRNSIPESLFSKCSRKLFWCLNIGIRHKKGYTTAMNSNFHITCSYWKEKKYDSLQITH